MSTAVVLVHAPESRWTVVRGSMKGAVRVMNVGQYSVGRSPECEFIIVNDPKCSRKHAAVNAGPDGFEIVSLNAQNLLLLNGREIERATLKDGDVVTFGETECQFSVGAVQLQPIAGGQAGAPSPMPYQASTPTPARKRKPQAPKQSNSKRFIIYGVLALVVYFILQPVKKKEAIPIRNEAQTQADIDAATKLKEAKELENSKRNDPNANPRQAQENYVRGFRDYRKGQYERSLTSFQACLALAPEHVLCNRYLRLAQRKFSELTQYYVLLGRKQRDQNQFQACRSSFKNVMVMVKDANSPIYKEAKANYEACNASLEGRY